MFFGGGFGCLPSGTSLSGFPRLGRGGEQGGLKGFGRTVGGNWTGALHGFMGFKHGLFFDFSRLQIGLQGRLLQTGGDGGGCCFFLVGGGGLRFRSGRQGLAFKLGFIARPAQRTPDGVHRETDKGIPAAERIGGLDRFETGKVFLSVGVGRARIRLGIVGVSALIRIHEDKAL